ncbi:MAG: hypothetical protein ACT4TC_21355 [Myxococcaceae bacterium]
MRKLSLLVLSAVVFGSAACVAVHPTRAGYPQALAPLPADCPVRIYRTPPGEKYEEVGGVYLHGSLWMDNADAELRLHEEACKAGGNGVIIASEHYGTVGGGQVSAAVIRTGPPAPPAPPAPPPAG